MRERDDVLAFLDEGRRERDGRNLLVHRSGDESVRGVVAGEAGQRVDRGARGPVERRLVARGVPHVVACVEVRAGPGTGVLRWVAKRS